ncbi:putative OsmC-like protein [Bacillus ectoiniformans]|uniref:OsmC family protein n=1 Tax=Bacillus ectoiniformans TaxID=1494429 RepID=UPI00195B7361|nr:OsmC family protein [Bacillus ectoiniformans]MBM7647760.1 putative OsmC-like protein [Bacillus ectoiniformans]
MISTEKLVKVSTGGLWEGGVKTGISIRNFEKLIMDEPAALGGEDHGPNPMEYVLAALSGCTSVVIALVGKEMDFSYTGVEFKNSGVIDLRGLEGQKDVSPHFKSVRFEVILTTNETEARINELKAEVERRCPVFNLIQDAGVEIKASWKTK